MLFVNTKFYVQKQSGKPTLSYCVKHGGHTVSQTKMDGKPKVYTFGFQSVEVKDLLIMMQLLKGGKL